MRSRHGNVVIVLAFVAAIGGGAVLYTSPDMAQDMLPSTMLPVFPQFEQVDTGRNCTTIGQAQEFVNLFGANISDENAQEFFCQDKCELTGKTTAGTYCQEEILQCVCRSQNATA